MGLNLESHMARNGGLLLSVVSTWITRGWVWAALHEASKQGLYPWASGQFRESCPDLPNSRSKGLESIRAGQHPQAVGCALTRDGELGNDISISPKEQEKDQKEMGF